MHLQEDFTQIIVIEDKNTNKFTQKYVKIFLLLNK